MKYQDYMENIGWGLMIFPWIAIDGHILIKSILCLLGMFLWISGLFTLCPRCKMHISQRATKFYFSFTKWSSETYSRYCIRCGRDRHGVKPFQFYFKPEAWDGKYHDEGGGEQPDPNSYF